MSVAPIATVRDERPVYLTAGDDTLFAVLTQPPQRTPGPAVLVLAGAGQPSSANPDAFAPQMCRTVAGHGLAGMRIDFRGSGESTGTGNFRLSRPKTEDAIAAARWLQAGGYRPVTMVGFCYGAATALATAVEFPDTGAVVLVSMPIRRFDWRSVQRLAEATAPMNLVRRALDPRRIRRLLRSERRGAFAFVIRQKLRRGEGRRDRAPAWVDVNAVRRLEALRDRGVPVLLVYGSEDEFLRDVQGPAQPLRSVLGGDAVRLATVPGHVHSFLRVETQEAVVEAIRTWMLDVGIAKEPSPATYRPQDGAR